MKTLERWLSTTDTADKGSLYAALKPLMGRLAAELGGEWLLTFNDEACEAIFTHGIMQFVLYAYNSNIINLKCGNGKINYTLSQLWSLTSGVYCSVDVLEADDRGTIVIGFKSTAQNDSSYGFNLIWGKYDDESEYLVWGTSVSTTSEVPASLLDDTAAIARTFPNVLENTAAPWCFGKLPKTNLAVLPKSLYFGSSVPYRAHYVELLRGDKKYVGFATAKAAAKNAVTGRPSMFAVPVKSFEIEHIKV